MLEHAYVYTIGRGGDRAHLLIDEATLATLGISCHEVDRGGVFTYHGPGQLVGYAIVGLDRLGIGVREYMRGLETALIRTAAHFGVEAVAVPGHTGVWAGQETLVALGVKAGRGVAHHGFALNGDPDLSSLQRIVPCGIPDRGVTSLTRLVGRAISVDETANVCADAIAGTFGLALHWEPPAPVWAQ